MDALRGEVTIAGLSDAPIPWPRGKQGRVKTLVVYADLADAVRRESNIAVCAWWGVSVQTVSKWRKALGVGRLTEGTSALLSECFTPDRQAGMRVARVPTYRDPKRSEKIRCSRQGKPRPKHVVEAMVAAHRGSTWSEQTRQRSLIARMKRQPRSYAPWTAEEDTLVRTLSARNVVKLTGRSKRVVAARRAELGVAKKLPPQS